MHAKHWTTLLFAGCLSVGGTARGQIAPPAPPQLLDDTQDVLIQPLPPGAPAAPGEDPLQAPMPVPPLPSGGFPAPTPPPMLQFRPGSPGGGYGDAYRVIARRQNAGSWLGVAVSQAPEALRHQLRLRDGAGLVVEQVMPDSPADRAGIQQYDVLETLDDQALTDPQELASTIRSHRSGDEVTIGIIREGKRREVNLKVARAASNIVRPPAPMMPGAMPVPRPRFGAAGGFGFFKPGAPPAPDAADPQAPGSTPKAPGNSISLYYRGNQLFATIYDSSGRVMMTGPVDALRSQKNLPREARRALEQLRDDGSDKLKNKPNKVRKHRPSNDDDGEENDDDAPGAR